MTNQSTLGKNGESERHCVRPVVRTFIRSRQPFEGKEEEGESKDREKERGTSLVCASRSGFTHDRPKGEDPGAPEPRSPTAAPRRFLRARRAPRGRGDTPKRRSIVQVTKKRGDIFFFHVPSLPFIPSRLSCNTPLHSTPACVCTRPPTAHCRHVCAKAYTIP